MINDWFVKEKPFNSGTTTTGGSGGFGVSNSGAGGGWPFNLDNLRFDGKKAFFSAYPSTSVNTTMHGRYLKPDGTAFYVTQSSDGDRIRKYTMSTPFDISTCSYDTIGTTQLRTDYSFYPAAIFFKPDGTRVFYLDGTNTSHCILRSYTLSTPWDITGTMTEDSNSYDIHQYTGNVAIYSFTFKPDGTRFWTCDGNSTSAVYEFSLSSAWDLGNVSFVRQNSQTYSGYSNGYLSGISWKPDGTKFYTTHHGSSSLREATASTPWEASPSSLGSVGGSSYYQALNSLDSRGNNIQWKSDGTRAYALNSYDEFIHELQPSTAWTIGGPIYGNDLSYYNDNAYTDLIHIYKKTNYQSLYSMRWNPDGTKFYLSPSTSGIKEFSVSTPYDFKSTWSNTGASIPNTGLGYGIIDISYNADGTRFFLMEIQNHIVKQYNLSTGFDLSTETDANADLDLTVGSGASGVSGGAIADTGRYIYMCRSSTIYQWTLSTPWELSTASYTASISLSSMGRMKISPDGKQIITMYQSVGEVTFKSYNLSTAWDITTATLNKTKTLAQIGMPEPGGGDIYPCWDIHDDQWDFMPYYATLGYRLYC